MTTFLSVGHIYIIYVFVCAVLISKTEGSSFSLLVAKHW